jgi:hypothetical protein
MVQRPSNGAPANVDLTSEFKYHPPRMIFDVSVPFISIGGWAGSMKNLPWNVHSPSKTLRASCSLPGFGISCWAAATTNRAAMTAFISFPPLTRPGILPRRTGLSIKFAEC